MAWSPSSTSRGMRSRAIECPRRLVLSGRCKRYIWVSGRYCYQPTKSVCVVFCVAKWMGVDTALEYLNASNSIRSQRCIAGDWNSQTLHTTHTRMLLFHHRHSLSHSCNDRPKQHRRSHPQRDWQSLGAQNLAFRLQSVVWRDTVRAGQFGEVTVCHARQEQPDRQPHGHILREPQRHQHDRGRLFRRFSKGGMFLLSGLFTAMTSRAAQVEIGIVGANAEHMERQRAASKQAKATSSTDVPLGMSSQIKHMFLLRVILLLYIFSYSTFPNSHRWKRVFAQPRAAFRFCPLPWSQRVSAVSLGMVSPSARCWLLLLSMALYDMQCHSAYRGATGVCVLGRRKLDGILDNSSPQ
mmetsp:Transcript_5309/g.14349  ORF Transcript_5309/g.14349 Transcript_5309/m.14349 type:complete len:353 (+) Transcript_5309:982-2040(+)